MNLREILPVRKTPAQQSGQIVMTLSDSNKRQRAQAASAGRESTGAHNTED